LKASNVWPFLQPSHAPPSNVCNHLAKYVTMQTSILHFHLDPTFIYSLSFQAILGGQGSVSGWKAWLVSNSEPKPKIIKEVSLYFVIKKS
jgi:hypothetical protein